MSRLHTEFAGIAFKNPVVLASGTCGFGRELAECFDIEKLGGLSSKGLIIHPHGGNDGIRIWETPSGIMNSVGLENPGIEAFIEQVLDWINEKDVVNIVNMGGHSKEDYFCGAERLNDVNIDILELNISCPNVKEGGMNFGVEDRGGQRACARGEENQQTQAGSKTFSQCGGYCSSGKNVRGGRSRWSFPCQHVSCDGSGYR